ncbi:P-loop containing nucleoside triphosphate hydrolase protein [Mycena galopus ATCC 62051]|nr:P-loop containing nucleoside triphosphate hydrolase protein [Mycena galopus ATCC 62051]
MSSNTPQPSQTPQTPRRRPFSPIPTRSPGTPRRHVPARSTRLQGIREWKFTVEETRAMVIDKLKLHYVPDDWQIHLIIRILRGYDSIFLAGTGYGKSLVFEAVAVLGGRKKVTIIVCPLKALEADQVNQANEKGISALAINEDNTTDHTVWRKAQKSAQLVYISPEMALSDRFGGLWMDARFRSRVNTLIVDEAHCIDEWGEEFRPMYRQLHRLRSYTGQEVPFVAYLDDTSDCARIPKILTYHGSVAGTTKAKAEWRRALPAHLRSCVVSYSADISEAAKKDIWEGFLSGRYRILCATDAAGMGCNVPDIDYSIVFERPRSLAVLVQRWGRAGRNRTGIGTCLFFVQPWAYRPAPPEVGLAVHRLKGEDKIAIESQSQKASRGKLEPNLEAFINSGTSSEACSHVFLAQLFRPETGLDVYTGLTDPIALKSGPISSSSSHELSWTVLNLKRNPPPRRCCEHCNPHLFNWLKPSNSRDPRILKYASEFIHSLPPPPSRPTSPASVVSDSGTMASFDSVEFEPVRGKQTVSQEDKAALRERLIAWRKDRHFRMGSSPYIPCEVLLPPKQLEKLVSSCGTFLNHALVEPKHVLKAVPWDMAPASDVAEVCDIIACWRLTLDIPRTPQSACRARKQPPSQPPVTPQPVFTPRPAALPNPATPRSSGNGRRGGSRGGRGGTP